jgi:hypothetical protein
MVMASKIPATSAADWSVRKNIRAKIKEAPRFGEISKIFFACLASWGDKFSWNRSV